jgi:signal transduction histidine kinase
MPRLFEKFASKSNQGTGLGLYICKSIIEAHGCKIWAKNNIDYGNNGATFTFTLPRSNNEKQINDDHDEGK